MKRKEWLVNGDRNTTFFQRRANYQRKKKFTIKIHDDCGVWIDEPKAIADKFTADFYRRFKSNFNSQRCIANLGITHVVTEQQNSDLVRLPNLDEVRNALFSIDSNKTPGPDGFGAGFFKKYWHIIKKDLFNAISELFRTGKLLKS